MAQASEETDAGRAAGEKGEPLSMLPAKNSPVVNADCGRVTRNRIISASPSPNQQRIQHHKIASRQEEQHRNKRKQREEGVAAGGGGGEEEEEEEEEEREMALESLFMHLINVFPSRNQEIKQILSLIGEPSDPLLPLFVYGGASTGKTSILLETFKQLKRPFAYTSCRSSHSPRILFESILNQLYGHVRTSENGFCSAKKCDKLGDFLSFLPDACLSAIASGKSKHGQAKKNQEKETTALLPMVYFIFDNVELLLEWSGGFRLISSLVRLQEFSRLQNLGVIFVSSLGPDAFFSGTGMLEPLPVYMRDYTDDDLHQILVRRKPDRDLYSSFLSAVLKPFSRVTRRVTELSEALEPLFQKYIDPIRRGMVKPDEQGKRKLFSLIQPHITTALHQICGFSYLESPRILPSNGQQRRGSVDQIELGFQLPLCSKYLLISAFICSRNPATLDATLFDASGGGGRKRKRKSSQASIEKKEHERQEKLLKGPGTFPLERLLAIFCCISAEFVVDEDEIDTSMLTLSEVKHGVEMSSDVLMQISTLVKSNLLYKGTSDPLEGTPRYRCNVAEELVQMVARSIDFPLSRYLYRM